jgi:sugar-specific transcriptional regulator TrmB
MFSGGSELFSEEVEVLMDLGLTSCQARVYLALCHFGTLDVKTISKHSKVPRQDCYRVTSDLQELGLIEKTISRPVTFKATEVEKGTAILLRRRKNETEKLTSKTEDLLMNFETKNNQVQLGKPEVVLVPGKEAIIDRISCLITKSQNSIDVVSSWKRFSHVLSFASVLEKAWSRGVRCRFVIEKPPKNRGSKLILDFSAKTRFCPVRFVPFPPNTVISIYDNKEILIVLNPEEDLLESPALWSSNSSIVAAMRDYFDILWLTAMEIPEYNLDNIQT